jgi:hypothetical protein
MDLLHNYGSDLNVSATGDLAIAAGTIYGQQRVIRRLLTNQNDYSWHPTYGAGLSRFVGQHAGRLAISAVIQNQMRRELAVSQNPKPVVTVNIGDDGLVYAHIQYVDNLTQLPVALSVPLDG